MTHENVNIIDEIADSLRKKAQVENPEIVLILGSGLGKLADSVQEIASISYEQIPHFPKTSVPGHQGKCIFGKLGKYRTLVFQGRFHYYEGHSLFTTVLPVRVAARLGARALFVTNAAGSLRKDMPPGSLMMMKDHINLMGDNPLRGPNIEELGERFIDLTRAYDPEFQNTLRIVAKNTGIDLFEGVYAALSGPSYETPAEIRMLKTLGADAVGMSTVPEVIAARHAQLRVLGCSCVTNYAAGLLGEKAPALDHLEVIENSRKAQQNFTSLVKQWFETIEI